MAIKFESNNSGVTTTGLEQEAASQKVKQAGTNESTFNPNPAGIATKGFEADVDTTQDVADAFSKFKANTSEAFSRMAGLFKPSPSKEVQGAKIPEGLTEKEFSNDKVEGLLLAARRFKTMGEITPDNILNMVADAEVMGIDTSALTSKLGPILSGNKDG